MAIAISRHLKQKVADALEDRVSATVRQAVTRASRPRVQGMIQRFNHVGPDLRPRKEYAIQNLPDLVDKAVAKLRENGCAVFRAATSAQAVEYILQLVRSGSVVKSKSNAAKEIGLVEALENNGIQVVETDLGDRICQLGNIPASHPIGPALHVPVQKVADLFSRETNEPVPAIPEEIVKIGRRILRQKFLQADVGISGANAIAADTGSVVVTENEGNIRCVSNLPATHIVVAGIEKIVATLEDCIKVVRAASLHGVGQDIGTYVSVISGPSRTCAVEGKETFGLQGPGQVHIVLLEEGRREAMAEGFAMSLYCINCGACMGHCPVYSEMGEKYGYKYFGGIGIIHTAFRNGLDKAEEAGLSLCLGCRKCVAACPVSIDTPGMIRRLRLKVVSSKGLDLPKIIIIRHLLSNGSALQRIAPSAARLLFKKDGRGGMHSRYSLPGIDRQRRFPEPAGRSFLSRLPEIAGAAGKKVGYFAGCLNNTVFPGVAEATVKILKQSGARVIIPAGQKCCGYPSLVNGDRDNAIRLAISNLETFSRAGVEAVVTDCATCYSGLLGYPDLLSKQPAWQEKALEFSQKLKDFCQYLSEVDYRPVYNGPPVKVTYHQPCHHTCHGIAQGKTMLQSITGLEFVSSQLEENCCGFGGAFSLDFYHLSKTICQRKVSPVLESDAGVLATSCPGCMVQLMDIFSQNENPPAIMHISELLSKGGGRSE